jgi:hypothetical protein
MPWMGDQGGPYYNRGRVPNEQHGGGMSWSPWRNRPPGRDAHPDDRSFRGQWQRAGHGPPAARDYGWEYQGGYPHDASVIRSEAGMGDAMGSYFAQQRSGGLPRGRERFDVDRWGGPLGRGGYDREMYRRDQRIRYGMDYMRDRWG